MCATQFIAQYTCFLLALPRVLPFSNTVQILGICFYPGRASVPERELVHGNLAVLLRVVLHLGLRHQLQPLPPLTRLAAHPLLGPVRIQHIRQILQLGLI